MFLISSKWQPQYHILHQASGNRFMRKLEVPLRDVSDISRIEMIYAIII
jgi:hypothetical protein